MKFGIRFIILMALFASSIAAQAYNESDSWGYWQWKFIAGVNDDSVVNMPQSEFQVNFDASDNYDPLNDKLICDITPAVNLATYHDKDVDGWNGPTGFYQRDVRSPVPLQEGQTKSWLIYIWATPDMPVTCNTIDVVCFSLIPNPIYWPEDLGFNLTLKAKPQGIVDGPNTGTTWELGLSHGAILQLPMYRTNNGLTGYQFELTATVVPEPSSILALLCGLGSLSAFKFRKKK